ncbi:Uncharacterised protein [BD1-7 clade bacterium]|uniref:Uncharacterized protein n=1 Tax=BD1-7 clade bacterium TaxID=2029982 RepID=A0A5S9QJA3_9GAMM|nr:Uncharacterised protein [BD1-7 clade bacterium]
MIDIFSWIPTGVFILIGTFTATLTAFVMPRYNRCREASIQFRNAILDCFKEVYPHPDKWPDDFKSYLIDRYPLIQAEVQKYRPFVPFYKIRKYDDAWNNFRGFDKDDCFSRETDFFQYRDYSLDGVPNDGKMNFRENLAKLLSFSNKI